MNFLQKSFQISVMADGLKIYQNTQSVETGELLRADIADVLGCVAVWICRSAY
jgi:hypothetical protein